MLKGHAIRSVLFGVLPFPGLVSGETVLDVYIYIYTCTTFAITILPRKRKDRVSFVAFKITVLFSFFFSGWGEGGGGMLK